MMHLIAIAWRSLHQALSPDTERTEDRTLPQQEQGKYVRDNVVVDCLCGGRPLSGDLLRCHFVCAASGVYAQVMIATADVYTVLAPDTRLPCRRRLRLRSPARSSFSLRSCGQTFFPFFGQLSLVWRRVASTAAIDSTTSRDQGPAKHDIDQDACSGCVVDSTKATRRSAARVPPLTFIATRRFRLVSVYTQRQGLHDKGSRRILSG